VNDQNEIFTVQKVSIRQWTVEKVEAKISRKPPGTRNDMMAVVKPTEDTTRLFWINGAEWVLRLIESPG